MKYRIAKKKLKRNVLLNLWLTHVKINIDIIRCDQNNLSDLSKLVISISYKMLNFEYDQLKKIQKEMQLRNYQFHHYIGDQIYGNKY